MSCIEITTKVLGTINPLDGISAQFHSTFGMVTSKGNCLTFCGIKFNIPHIPIVLADVNKFLQAVTTAFSDKYIDLAQYTLGGSRLDGRWCLGGSRRYAQTARQAYAQATMQAHTNQLKDNGVREHSHDNVFFTFFYVFTFSSKSKKTEFYFFELLHMFYRTVCMHADG